MSSHITQLHPADIEAALKKKGASLTSIARSLNISRTLVSGVVNHQTKVMNEIERLLKEPINQN